MEVGLTSRANFRSRLLKIGRKVLQEKHPLIPGALTALRKLKRDGHELHCITGGDEAVQLRKMDEVGITAFFETIEVTQGGKDKRSAIEARVNGRDPSRAMMVGDSKLRDIVPAVDLGIVAVFVPGDTWPLFDAEVERGKYHRIESVSELPGLITALRPSRP